MVINNYGLGPKTYKYPLGEPLSPYREADFCK